MKWDTDLYDNKHAFVSKYGEGVVELLDPKASERILDVGCGTGHLTHEIATRGASVIGMDSSPEMIQTAKETYPDMQFVVADASSFKLTDLGASEPFDAIFSNAALHWVHRAEAAIECMAAVLRVGGRFVVEFGGRGNVNTIVTSLQNSVHKITGQKADRAINYFPSIGEYCSMLEKHGIEVVAANLFDRPTRLEGDSQGLGNWIRMFRNEVLKPFAPEVQSQIIADVENQARSQLLRDGVWYADYRRLRLVAFRR